VAATSARNAWAVGFITNGNTLTERWNGTIWKKVHSPSPTPADVLFGVTGTSAGSTWAVGSTGSDASTVILRWNGTAWKKVRSPTLASGSTLNGVAATSARNAWAVGNTASHTKTLILRWDGADWDQA